MTLHSFFPHPSLFVVIGPYAHLIPAKSYFYVNNVDLVKQLPLNLIDASQYFFHYQLETNKQPRPQSNF